MFTTHQRRRSAVICALACAALTATVCSAAVARPTAQERYYSSFESSPAQTQEAYYSSYGAPEPISPAPAPVPGDSTPWLAIAASLAGGLLIVSLGATQVHRLRLRRRRAAGAAM